MMFKKVLIAEDHESISISVQKTLTDLGIHYDARDYVYYCDDALSRVKKALSVQEPYELLITDISFDTDIPQALIGGRELIKAVKAIQPDIKTLVFSIENRMAVASTYINELGVDAFVPKARGDAKDLKIAIESLTKNKTYLSPNLRQLPGLQKKFDFTPYDKKIIHLLAAGTAQKDIPLYLQKTNIRPAGLSSVEKRLHTIKTTLNISSNEQLVAYCKDLKVI